MIDTVIPWYTNPSKPSSWGVRGYLAMRLSPRRNNSKAYTVLGGSRISKSRFSRPLRRNHETGAEPLGRAGLQNACQVLSNMLRAEHPGRAQQLFGMEVTDERDGVWRPSECPPNQPRTLGGIREIAPRPTTNLMLQPPEGSDGIGPIWDLEDREGVAVTPDLIVVGTRMGRLLRGTSPIIVSE